MIEFSCQNCGHKINAPLNQAGRSCLCPKCKSVVFIPWQEPPPESAEEKTDQPKVDSKFSDRDKLLLDIPIEEETPAQPAEQTTPPVLPEVSEKICQQAKELRRELGMGPIEPPQFRKYPWFFDIFLYPINISGVIHLLAFVFLPWLITAFISLLSFFIPPVAGQFFGYMTRLLTLPVYAVFYGYVCYFITHCVTDSSQGGLRVPDIGTAEAFDIGDIISQIFLILGCVAVCFGPAAVYYFFTKRTDLWFWLLVSYGTFFLPMVFLAGAMFGNVNALNPILVVGSILSAFSPYCALVIFFGAVGGFISVILPELMPGGIILSGIRFYSLFVLAHVSGRFYWRYKDKLSWEV
jgi:hypothetical protein